MFNCVTVDQNQAKEMYICRKEHGYCALWSNLHNIKTGTSKFMPNSSTILKAEKPYEGLHAHSTQLLL